MSGIYRILVSEKDNKKIFDYFYSKNNQKVSQKDLERIKKLKIPPNVDKVWISENADDKIQAKWTDDKERVQYKYHDIHIEQSTKQKFHKLYDFIHKIQHFENKIKKHLTLDKFNKKRTLALMFQIVQELNIRVGKETYAQQNKSYGISSVKKKHFKFLSDRVIIKFKAKSNQRVSYTIKDKKIIEQLQILNNLEGIKMFQYINDMGKVMKVSDQDMNKYLQSHMGPQFTVKDFRTFGSNYYFIKSLLDETNKRLPKNNKIIKKNLLNAFKSTAFYLRHTKSISKKSYVNAIITEIYQTEPQFFIDRKNNDPIDVLVEILEIYKKHNQL